MTDYRHKDSALHELIISRLAILGISKTELASSLCMSYHTFARKLARPEAFTITEIRTICDDLSLNITEVRGYLV